jgi:sulfur dioxygenase
MLFRQLLDPNTSTYTYLLGDEATHEALIIDPVREQLTRDIGLVKELGLILVGALETHVHADHVTGAAVLREKLGCRLFVGEHAGVLTADKQLQDGDLVSFGGLALQAMATPGHTSGCVSFFCEEEGMAFTGDALLIRGCGRTDFQDGDAQTLYKSVHDSILSLPESTQLYPGHDYRGHTVTTVREERQFNPRLGSSKTPDEFVRIMNGLKLAYPKRIDEAIPANMASGATEPEEAKPSTRERDDWAPIERTVNSVAVVSPCWVASRAGHDLRIIDVREHIEFCGPLGHIASGELIPLSQLEKACVHWDRNEPLILVCAYGTRSAKAMGLLEAKGFDRVASLHGGMTRWADEGLPCVEIMGDRASEDATTWQI